MPKQHSGTVLYYAGDKPHGEYDTFSIGVTPDDPSLIPQGKKCIYVSEKAGDFWDQEKSYLRSLRKNDRITFFEAGRGKTGPYYSLLETNAQGGFAIEDPVVDEVLGPRPPVAQAPQPIAPRQQVPPNQPEPYASAVVGPTQPPLADEWENFGGWADMETRKMSTLYAGLRDKLSDGEIATRDLQKMAVSLYIQYNMDKKR